jgi:hypothetical protein
MLAQDPDYLFLAESAALSSPVSFSGDGLYLISAEFSGCLYGPSPARKVAAVII